MRKPSCKINRKLKNYAEKSVRYRRRIILHSPTDFNNTSKVTNIDSSATKPVTARDVLNDYLNSSSVHGLQYFGDISVKVNLLGKFLWFSILIAGFVCLTLMVMQFWTRFSNNPTNTYVQSFFAPIQMASFPAVTVCPFAPVPQERQLEVLENIQIPPNMDMDEAMFMIKYGHDLLRPYIHEQVNYSSQITALLKLNNWRIPDFLKRIRPCEDIVDKCWWDGKLSDCSRLFQISHTSKGICCSFNYIIERYIPSQRNARTLTPLRTGRYGPESGLTVIFKGDVLTSDNGTDALTRSITNSDGILASVHSALDYAGDEISTFIIQANQEIQVSISPFETKKSPGIYYRNSNGEMVPVCIADDPKVQKYFPVHTYTNCYTSCKIEAMIKLCGCIPYNYDFVAQVNTINSCEFEGLECLTEYDQQLRIVQDTKTDNVSCTCTFPCKNTIYDGLPIEFSIEAREFSPFYQDLSDGQAVLRVYYSSELYTVHETISSANEIYLLSSIGGIFCLFLGCSFLSVVEIAYFCGLLCRAIFSSRKSKNHFSAS